MAGPSRSLVEVGISMVLQDGFTSQAGKISSSYSSLMNNMNQQLPSRILSERV